MYVTLFKIDDGKKLTNDIHTLINWCHYTGMIFNVDKFWWITFTRHKSSLGLHYAIGSNIIQMLNKLKDMGVNIDSQMAFVFILIQLLVKDRKFSAVLRNIKQWFPVNYWYFISMFYSTICFYYLNRHIITFSTFTTL